MKFFLKQTIYLLPIILMGVSFFAMILHWFGYEINYVVWGNIAGYSLVTNVLFMYVFYYGNYCIFTKLSPIPLSVCNIVNIWGFYNPEYYRVWYEMAIISITLTLLFIYELNRRIFK